MEDQCAVLCTTAVFLQLNLEPVCQFALPTLDAVWLGGRVVRTLHSRSTGRDFDSQPLRYRVQPWASC